MTEFNNNMTAQEKRTYVLKELKKEIDNIKVIQQEERKEDYIKEDDGLYREPLSIDKTEEIKILLSWGGGEDGYKLRFKDNDLISGVYYYADWGVYEEVDLNEDELNLIFDFYLYGEKP